MYDIRLFYDARSRKSRSMKAWGEKLKNYVTGSVGPPGVPG